MPLNLVHSWGKLADPFPHSFQGLSSYHSPPEVKDYLFIPGKACLWWKRGVAQGCFYSDMGREVYQLQESLETYCRETPARMTLTREDSRDMGPILLLSA